MPQSSDPHLHARGSVHVLIYDVRLHTCITSDLNKSNKQVTHFIVFEI